MIKYVLLDKDRFIQNNSDVSFPGATKIVFQDDWENDFNRFYRKFYVKENDVVTHPNNLPSDPITNRLTTLENDLKQKGQDLNESTEKYNKLKEQKEELEKQVQLLQESNDSFVGMASKLFGDFAQFQAQFEEKQQEESSNNSNQ